MILVEEDFSLDLSKYHGLNETIVIANPNAPTTLLVGAENAVRFLVRSDSSPSADHSFRFQPAYKIPNTSQLFGIFL